MNDHKPLNVDTAVASHSVENAGKTSGRLVSSIRDARGLTQKDVAGRLGKSRAWVSLVESGQRSLRLEDVPSWAAALGVDPFKLERLFRGCRGQLWRDGEWEFYNLGVTDLSEVDGNRDQEQAHREAINELTKLVNELADPLGDRKAALWDDRGIVLLKDGVHAVPIPINFPLTAAAVEEVVPQGTRADIDQLLIQLTSQQLALSSAFMRGLLAQARSRRQDHHLQASADHES